MDRRSFLAFGACLPAASISPVVHAQAPVAGMGGRIFVPGYFPELGLVRGCSPSVHSSVSRARQEGTSRKGPATLLTCVALGGDTKHALFPIQGHGVFIAPDGKTGVFCSMEGTQHALFDTETLDLLVLAPSLANGWRGGGHAAFNSDGAVLLTERAPRGALMGEPAVSRYGRISIRDPKSLKVIDSYSSYGIDPHDLAFFDSGRLLVVANYGSVPLDGESELGVPRHVVQACVSIIDVATGRLIDKIVSPDPRVEVRHLGLCHDRIAAIRTWLDDDHALKSLDRDRFGSFERDFTTQPGVNYQPVSPMLYGRGEFVRRMGETSSYQPLMRQGLSIIGDTERQEFIAGFPSSHSIMVFDARDGKVLRHIDTRSQGLLYPCGIAFLPDGVHYAVAGYSRGLHVYKRGTHQMVMQASLACDFFGHSHIAAV